MARQQPDQDNFIPGTNITLDDRMTLQRTFLYTEDGKNALKWLLMNLGLYKEVKSENDAALHSFALRIMNTLGLLENANAEAIIDEYVEIVRKDALRPGLNYIMKEGRENVRHPKP